MSNAVSESSLSMGSPYCAPCRVGMTEQSVLEAVDAIITRMIPTYCALMREAKKNPEVISDRRSILHDYYTGQSLTLEDEITLQKAETMAPNWSAVTQTYRDHRISVFSENREFTEARALANTRFYIKLKVDTETINKGQDQDPLDALLSQLSKTILTQGYGEDGTFDVRLEKGYMSLEGDPWKWHYDSLFKTSITVCYSNKKNWSTRIKDAQTESDGKPADHDVLYDALTTFHRAPIPSDLKGDELQANDYRLFIRYNEFYSPNEINNLPEPEESKKTLNLKPFEIRHEMYKPQTDEAFKGLSAFTPPPLFDAKVAAALNSELTKLSLSPKIPHLPLEELTPPTLSNVKLDFSESLLKLETEPLLTTDHSCCTIL